MSLNPQALELGPRLLSPAYEALAEAEMEKNSAAGLSFVPHRVGYASAKQAR
jgi:hypothetical protein